MEVAKMNGETSKLPLLFKEEKTKNNDAKD